MENRTNNKKKQHNFNDVAINQNFLAFHNKKGSWYRKQSETWAIREEDDYQSVFYPNDVIAIIGRKTRSIALSKVRRDNQIVTLLLGNHHSKAQTCAEAKLEASKLGLGISTPVNIIN